MRDDVFQQAFLQLLKEQGAFDMSDAEEFISNQLMIGLADDETPDSLAQAYMHLTAPMLGA